MKDPDESFEFTITIIDDDDLAPEAPAATSPAAPLGAPPAPVAPGFVVAEIGLPAPLVWAAVLSELARSRAVSPNDLQVWLRPAALVGRDGATLLVGVPNATAQSRVQRRLLSEIRSALARVIGVTLPVAIVVAPEPPQRHAAAPPESPRS